MKSVVMQSLCKQLLATDNEFFKNLAFIQMGVHDCVAVYELLIINVLTKKLIVIQEYYLLYFTILVVPTLGGGKPLLEKQASIPKNILFKTSHVLTVHSN